MLLRCQSNNYSLQSHGHFQPFYGNLKWNKRDVKHSDISIFKHIFFFLNIFKDGIKERTDIVMLGF